MPMRRPDDVISKGEQDEFAFQHSNAKGVQVKIHPGMTKSYPIRPAGLRQRMTKPIQKNSLIYLR